MEDPNLYRKKALEKLSSPEQLDKLLFVVKPSGWMGLITCFIIIIIGTLWTFFGSISTIASGDGIYLDFSQIHQLTIPINGKILEIPVTIGEKVEKGQILAIIWDKKESKKLEIQSPYDGMLIDIHTEKGTQVSAHQIFASLQALNPSNFQDRFYCFLPARKGDKITIGMQAYVYPWGVDKKTHGGILCKVKQISYLPATDHYFRSIYLNQSFVEKFTSQEPLLPIILDPIEDPTDPRKFIWTSQSGPQKGELPLGSLVSADILIEKRSPISYLFPTKKKNE
ncbi:MAG: biotin/lipoyl-containing protein [Chlamydiota bacterium]